MSAQVATKPSGRGRRKSRIPFKNAEPSQHLRQGNVYRNLAITLKLPKQATIAGTTRITGDRVRLGLIGKRTYLIADSGQGPSWQGGYETNSVTGRSL